MSGAGRAPSRTADFPFEVAEITPAIPPASLYAENREREKSDCNAGCDNEESITDVPHGIPRRPKEVS
jgi:hypothetical protein